MRLLIARMNHETNSFSPVPTPWSSFGVNGPAMDEVAREESLAERTAMTAFLHLAQAAGAQTRTPLSAMAFPSGPVARDAFERMCDAIVAAAPGCDGAMLDLHGAMVVDGYDDGEGELLRRLRQACPGLPIAVVLDLHGNLTAAMMAHADIIVAFKTYPHVDMYETGEHAGRLLLRMMQGEIRPTQAWVQLPLMSHTLRSATDAGAMALVVAAARQAEADGLLAVSVMAGFSLSDIPSPCMAVVAVADDDAPLAQALAERIAALVWQNREDFIYHSPPLADSIARALAAADDAALGSGPVLLLDHSDNCMSGGTCDAMDVLQQALAHGVTQLAVGPICDPQAVDVLIRAGVGAQVSVLVGNKVVCDRLRAKPLAPMLLQGTVRAITDGQFRVTGPTYTGRQWRMGRTVVLSMAQADVVIVETPQEPLDLGVFTSVGIDPSRYRFVLLKSRMYCRPVFAPGARAVIECDAQGVTSSNYDLFPFSRLSRPLYPLDADTVWQP